ncbi:MAG TPA: CoA transferase, partial [Actinomycetota bacterium]|nr:CoA transferase [Actinomycetota bacterium]
GFGQGGPESRRPAYAPIVHAEVGLLHRTHRRTGMERTELPLSVADTNASLHGLVATLAAVILRERTGVGQHVDIAMIDATLVTDDQIHYELEDSEDTMGLPNDVWAAGPGDILVSADFRHLWRRLTEKLGMVDPAGADTPLAEKIRLRRAAVSDFLRGLADWDAVETAMAAMNVAWGQVRPGARLADQPTIRHRGSIAQVDDRAGGTRPIPQSPYRFSDAVSEVRGPAPHRGEHNDAVLGEWLGKAAGDIAALYAAGVLLRDGECPATPPG